ncbi:MAG: helix-turn-helix transcriptional regulator [Eggerthellaceae bacterium]|nr:helix-turn-helix transcriptional regulator [Eggerthellaceae bacterium]
MSDSFDIGLSQVSPDDQSLRLLIGENVRRLRTEQDLSKKTLARISGVSRPLLDKVERGEADLRASYISRIADSLSVPPAVLLTPHR